MKKPQDPLMVILVAAAAIVLLLMLGTFTEALTWTGSETFTRLKIF